MAMHAVASRDGEWWRTHWLGVSVRAVLALGLLAVAIGMGIAVDRGVTHGWSASARCLWVLVIIAAMLHGAYGLFEVLFQTEEDIGSAVDVRAQLNFVLVAMAVTVFSLCWTGQELPTPWRVAGGIAGTLVVAWGAYPALNSLDPGAQRRWAYDGQQAFTKAIVIAAGIWTIFLSVAGRVPAWLQRLPR